MFHEMVRAVGFAPTTSRFQAEYSTRLNYTLLNWSERRDSNPRPFAPKANALNRLSYTPKFQGYGFLDDLNLP